MQIVQTPLDPFVALAGMVIQEMAFPVLVSDFSHILIMKCVYIDQKY